MDWHYKFKELSYRLRTQLHVLSAHPSQGMILMLHRVAESSEEFCNSRLAHLFVTKDFLENLIVVLREQDYEIISMDQLWLDLTNDQLKSKFVVLTFDDGYRDSYDTAFPVLNKHAVPFTIYVPTAVPDTAFIWWYYMLDDLVCRNDAVELSVMGRVHCYDMYSNEQKQAAYSSLEHRINSIEPAYRNDLLTSFFSRYGLDAAAYSNKLSISWEQLAELAESGLATIGGHSVNHYNLAQLSLPDACNEMQFGRKRLEDKLGITVDHFSYPFGCKSAAHFREFELAKSLGFKTCTTSRHGCITYGHKYYLERLPRFSVNNDTTAHSLGH